VDAGKMPVPPGYPIFDISAGHLAALQGRAEFVADLQDEWGSWDAAFAPIRNDAGEVVALIELDADADARRLFKAVRARSLTLRIVFVMLWAFAGSVLAAQFLNRHLRKLTRSARELRAGGYGQDVDIRSLDEIGLLGRTFNSMVHGLREREFIRETFGRYAPRRWSPSCSPTRRASGWVASGRRSPC